METLQVAQTIESARKRAGATLVDPDIASISRENYLRNMPRSLATAVVPFALLLVCGLQLAQWPLMVAVLSLHAAVLGAMWYVSRRILAARSSLQRSLLWRGYRLLSLFSGALWASCMLPVVTIMGQDIAAMFACIVIIVSVTVSAMIVATQKDAFVAFLSGFMVCLLPQTVVYLEVIGFIPLIATLGLAPALIGLGDAIRKQDQTMLAIQLERQHLADKLAEALEAAEYLASQDSLTGLYNRRAFEAAAARLRAENPARQFIIVLIDLDNFKAINDRFGHSLGDRVLQRTAHEIAQCPHRHGLAGPGEYAVARWGGEEFVVLLQGRRADDAIMTVRRLRAQLILMRDPVWPDDLIVTASFGMASWEPGLPLHAAIAQADQSMYAAKRAGGDQIHMDELPHPALATLPATDA